MSEQPHAADDSLGRLIHAGGHREAPPAQAYERAFEAAMGVWQAKLRRRRRRALLAMAAAIAALGLGVALLQHVSDGPASHGQPLAQVARVIGAVRVRPPNAREWTSIQEDAGVLAAGAVVRTGAASALGLLVNQASIRLAADAELVLESNSQLRLIRGKVYVDTGPRGAPGPVIVTAAGSVADVGTQYEVYYDAALYRIRVREGAVLMQRNGQRRHTRAGEQVSIDGSGVLTLSSIAADDPAWRWVQPLASAPDIEDQPLTVLLDWVTRETGARIRYASPGIERKATTTILHGSIRHLEPFEALAVMLAATDLRHEVLADGTIMIK